jgi:hypothetical protein
MSEAMSVAAFLRDPFDASTTGVGAMIYGGVKVAVFAVVHDLDVGRAFAGHFPGQHHLHSTARLRGRDAYLARELPAFATFVYPEFDLTERQRLGFVDALLKRHPEVRELVIFTSVASICTDAIPDILQRICMEPPAWEAEPGHTAPLPDDPTAGGLRIVNAGGR